MLNKNYTRVMGVIAGIFLISPLCHAISLTPIWKGTFSNTSNWKINNWNVQTSRQLGANNIVVMPSTTADPSPGNDNYLRIKYPKGSANPSGKIVGGAQFFGAVANSNAPIKHLSYYVRFPTDFPFY